MIGGLKGYERLLSLSKDKENIKWKPLHMAGNWNGRNRRMAKLRAKNNWFKGKQEIDPPAEQTQASEASRGQDSSSPRMEESSNRMESNQGLGTSPTGGGE